MHQIFLCVDAPTYSAGLKNSSSNALGCLQAPVFLYACASKCPPMPGGLHRYCCPLDPVSVDVLSVCPSACAWVDAHTWALGMHVACDCKWEAGFFSSSLLLVVGAKR